MLFITSLTELPEDFGAADDERVDIGIPDLDDATNTSGYVQEFLRSKNVDEKRADYPAPAPEELPARIVKECFPLNKVTAACSGCVTTGARISQMRVWGEAPIKPGAGRNFHRLADIHPAPCEALSSECNVSSNSS